MTNEDMANYSRIELRTMAPLSGDKGLVAAFEAGEDIHKATAAEVFNVELESVNDFQRRSAKDINFGSMYGMSASGLYGLLKALNKQHLKLGGKSMKTKNIRSATPRGFS